MANKNGYSLKILTNNQPTIIVENGNCFQTSILKGSKYSLELSNTNSLPVDAYLKIDGKKMGSYRIIPQETITITRPIRRKKDLCFLEKTQEFSQQGLFKNTNRKLGEIEIIYRSGNKFDSDEEDVSYPFNKQVYRLEDYEFNSEYMNKYKREKKQILSTIDYEEQKIEIECCDCCNYLEEIESEPLSSMEIESNGFTAYGDDNTLKYKTFQALDYDSDETKIIINLFIKNMNLYEHLIN